MAPINKNPNITKKQTGAKPKISAVQRDLNDMNATSRNLLEPTQLQTQIVNGSTKGNSSKTQTSKTPSSICKNTEIVAPTRRDLNDLNDYLICVTNESKNQNNNNQTNSVANNSSGQLDTNCFELENLNFQENQRYCYPVRPIPRRNIPIHKSQFHQDNISGLSINSIPNNINNNINLVGTTVGVVQPTTSPGNLIQAEERYNLAQHQLQQNNNIFQQKFSIAQSLGAANQQFNLNNTDLSWEDRLNFIQYFLSLTSKSNTNNNTNNKRGLNIKSNMVNEKNDEIFNSASLEDVEHNNEGTNRAHSISSIHTVTSDTPSTPNYDELQARLEHSNRNIQNIKDQQQQLIRLQQAAKQHLSDMQNLRANLPIRCTQLNGQNSNAPDYESVEEVHSDMANIVDRMKNLQHFIQGQNELSAMLGDDSPDLLAEQELLQKKLDDLKSHRQEMKNLVNELQDINSSVEDTIQTQTKTNNPIDMQRSVPIDMQRNVQIDMQRNVQIDMQRNLPIDMQRNLPIEVETNIPIDMTRNVSMDMTRNVPIEFQRLVPIELIGAIKKEDDGLGSSQKDENYNNEITVKSEMDQVALLPHANDIIQQKVADINAMKQQLQRLKDMMATVKLIEEKTEHGKPANEIGMEERKRIEIPTSMKKEFQTNFSQQNNVEGGSEQGEEKMLVERVRLLQEMTADLRNQAVNLSSESERLRSLKDEIKRKCDDNRESVETVRESFHEAEPMDDDDKDLLKQEYEIKKKEFEKICQRLNSEEENNEVESVTTVETANDAPNYKSEEKPINSQFTESWRNPNSSNFRSCSSFHGSSSQPQPSNSSINARGKDSTDSGAVDVNGVTSLEAASIQSDSSRSFTMPPPPPPIRQVPWRINSQDHSSAATTSSTLPLYDQIPLAPPIASVPWQPYYYMYPPCNFSLPVPGTSGNNASAGASNDFLCSHPNMGITALQNVAGTTQGLNPDPVLLQQFIQTQQMLINSVCQCNQLLWHQQREINNLNNTVNLLQERLIHAAPNPDMLHTMRSDSVPPHSTVSNNNIFSHRAQSEQPLNSGIPSSHYQSATPLSPNQRSNYQNYSNYNSYQRCNMNNQYQNQNLQSQQQQQQHISSAAAYNYSTDQSSGTYIHHIPNNVHHSLNFNNVVPQSPTSILNNNNNNNSDLHQHVGPTPIFMNHHNNNISSSSATALHSINNHNTNLLNSIHNSLQQQQNTSTSALNNQVPPGNRANNYWDNFRSYSRQNLLSNNTCKTKSDETRQQIQRLQQQQQLQYHQPSSASRNFQQSNLINPQFNTNVSASAQNSYRTNAINNSLNNVGISENVFDFNTPVVNTNDLVAALGSPDFRNMNFNFRSNERKKLPSKTSKAKHLHHSSYNGINLFPRNDIDHNNFENWITDEDGAIGYDDETTSEEIKRNLLVNALKNDKFTSKFFETLQEDVYRQAYRIIQDKKSDREFLLNLIDELKDSNAYNPLKNILLNSLNNSQSSLDQRKQAEQTNQNCNGTESNDGDNEMDTTYFDFENINFSSNHESLHDTPSSDKATRLINHKDTKILTNNKGNSNARKNVKGTEQKTNMSGDESGNTPLRIMRPDLVLIKYVIHNIRKEFNLSQPINETIMFSLAKSICNHLDNAIKNLSEKPKNFNWINSLTPKHVYDAIQNFDSNQDFIINLRNYLMEQHFILNNDIASAHGHEALIKSNVSTRNSEIKIENNLDGLTMIKNKNSKQSKCQKPFSNMNETNDNNNRSPQIKGKNVHNNENNSSSNNSNNNKNEINSYDNLTSDCNEEGAIALYNNDNSDTIVVDDYDNDDNFIWRLRTSSDVWLPDNQNVLNNDGNKNSTNDVIIDNDINDLITTEECNCSDPLKLKNDEK